MAYQFGAVTGRRRRPSYRALIESQIPYLTSLYAQREQEKLTGREMAQTELARGREIELGRERLGLQREQMTAQEAFEQEQLAFMQSQQGLQQRQTGIGQGLQAAQLGMQALQGYQMYNALAPAASTVPAITGTGGLAAPPYPGAELFAINRPEALPLATRQAMATTVEAQQALEAGTMTRAAAPSQQVTAEQTMKALVSGQEGQVAPDILSQQTKMALEGPTQAMAAPYALASRTASGALIYGSPEYTALSAKFGGAGGQVAGLTPGVEAALFTESGAGALGLEAGAGAEAGLITAPSAYTQGAGAGAGAGAEVSMATPATATPAAGGPLAGTGPVSAVGYGMMGYPMGYYGSKMLGAKASHQHGYGLLGTATWTAYLIGMGMTPWGMLALPAMMAMEPEATEATGKKLEEEHRRYWGDIEQETRRVREDVVGKEGMRVVRKAVKEPLRPMAQVAKEVTRVVGCILFSYLYGADSRQAHVTRVYCARKLHPETLIGYYQVAKKIISLCKAHPSIVKHVKRFLAEPVLQTMKHKLEIHKKPSLVARMTSHIFWGICSLTKKLTSSKKLFYPNGANVCIELASNSSLNGKEL